MGENQIDLSGRSPRPCACCPTFCAECHTPHGDGALETCWLCAHLLVVHEFTPAEAASRAGECACDRDDVYPPQVLARRDEARAQGSPEVEALRAEHARHLARAG